MRVFTEEQRRIRNERSKAYALANPDKIKAISVAWNASHPGYFAEKAMEYSKTHPGYFAEKGKAWYLANTERAKMQSAKYKMDNADKIKASYRANADAVKAQSALWRSQNPDKIQAWLANNPGYGKAYSRQRKEEIAGRKRPKRCDICKKSGLVLHYDHDHKTGLFRGWLCHNCNMGLGHAKDSISLLHKQANYLSIHKQRAKVKSPLHAAQKAYAEVRKVYEAKRNLKKSTLTAPRKA
jgi:hypothetical protein